MKTFTADEHAEFLKKDRDMGIISDNEYRYLLAKISDALEEDDPDIRELILEELNDHGIALKID